MPLDGKHSGGRVGTSWVAVQKYEVGLWFVLGSSRARLGVDLHISWECGRIVGFFVYGFVDFAVEVVVDRVVVDKVVDKVVGSVAVDKVGKAAVDKVGKVVGKAVVEAFVVASWDFECCWWEVGWQQCGGI